MSESQTRDQRPMVERWDDLFRALASQERRQLLGTLTTYSPHVWVNLPEGARSPYNEHTRSDLRVALVHQHLPLLEQLGYVQWRSSPLQARRGPNFGEVEAVIDSIGKDIEGYPDELVEDCEPQTERG